MKKYIKMLPVILYPYCFFLIVVILAVICNIFKLNADFILMPATLACLAIYNIYVLVISIVNIVMAAKGQVSACDMAKMNMIVKLAHIPGYIFYLILGFFSLMLSVWGIGFLLWAVISDLFSILMSGMTMVAAVVAGCKEGKNSKGTSVLLGITGFIYVIDVITAIVLFVICRKETKEKTPENTSNN